MSLSPGAGGASAKISLASNLTTFFFGGGVYFLFLFGLLLAIKY
jgi:hypothetical protein